MRGLCGRSRQTKCFQEMMNDNDIKVRRWLTTARRKMDLSHRKTYLSAAMWLQVEASSQGHDSEPERIKQIRVGNICVLPESASEPIWLQLTRMRSTRTTPCHRGLLVVGTRTSGTDLRYHG
jgi:hypothetical protein